MSSSHAAYQVTVASGTTGVVALPTNWSGTAQLSIAVDFNPAVVRLAIGSPTAGFRIEEGLDVPVGEKVVRQLDPTDELASIVYQQGAYPLSVLVEYQSFALALAAYQVTVPSGTTGIIGLPIDWGTTLSIAVDFNPAIIRLAIGSPTTGFRIEEGLAVPVGRQVVRALAAGDELASIVYQQGAYPLSVLVEYISLYTEP